jgi:hypothetical protein
MSKECASGIKDNQNMKMYGRNIPSSALQPYLNVRPVMTKYSKMPIVDPRKELNTQLQEKPLYNTGEVFNPGTRNAPWSGFSSNINLESELRNQIFAIQKCSQSVYVPQTTSDMYESNVPQENYTGSNYNLFRTDMFNNFNPNPCPNVIGKSLFHNSTREQLKNIEQNKK